MTPAPVHVSLLIVLVATLPGQAVDGAVAPANRWYTAGGCAARTGVAETRPVRHDPVEAWRYSVPGTIEGEPLVWDDIVVLAERRDDDRRYLHVLGLTHGKPRYSPKSFKTTAPLTPGIWHRNVVVRYAPNKLRGYYAGASSLGRRWSYDAKEQLAAPLLFGNEVYTGTAREVVRLQFGRMKPVWEARVKRRGRLALRGERVYTVEGDGFVPYLIALDRASGRRAGKTRVGNERAGMIRDDAEYTPVLGEHTFAVRASMRPGAAAETAIIPLKRGVADESRVLVLQSHAAPTVLGKQWIAFLTGEDGDALVMAMPGKPRLLGPATTQIAQLASPAHHAEFMQPKLPLSVAGGVVYAGARAFDRETHDVLWKRGLGCRQRPIPARETLLVVSDDRTLVALRERRPAPRAAAAGAAAAAGPVEAAKARVVLRDGTVMDTACIVDRAERRVLLGRGKRKREVPLADVLLAERGDREPLHWGAPADAVRALELLVDEETADGYAELADAAKKSNDVDLLGEILDECRSRGVDPQRLKSAERVWQNMTKASRRPKAKVVAEVRAARARLDQDVLAGAWARVAALPADAPRRLRLALLRAILARDPKHAEATAAVREMLPEELRDTEPFAAADWIDFVQAAGETEISFLAPRGDMSTASAEQRKLMGFRRMWRKDLVGIQSDRLLILTPLTTPGSIARCLSMGELVCDTLEQLFATDRRRRQRASRLVILLYENQREYLRQSRRAGVDHVVWTAGHYSPSEGISRMFLPAGEEAFERVMSVFAHELTHQWIDERCPRLSHAVRARPGTMGYWIIEGFASLIEDFVFDLATRTYETVNPRSRRLDLMANAKDDQLLHWADLYRLSHADFATKIGKQPDERLFIPAGWLLGKGSNSSQATLFYAQSAATCHYLFHAEDGRLRDELIDYVVKHYSNAERRELSVQQAFGLTAGELGKRVRAYAREIAELSKR